MSERAVLACDREQHFSFRREREGSTDSRANLLLKGSEHHMRPFRNSAGLELVTAEVSPAQMIGGWRSATRALALHLQYSGCCTSTVADITCSLAEGDFLLLDSTLAARLDFTAPVQVLILPLSPSYTQTRLHQLRRLTGTKMRGDRGAGALFSNFLRNAWQQMTADEAQYGDALSDVIWPLLDLALAGARSDPRDPSRRDERRRALFKAVEQDLCDPDLDVHHIARRMGVSARYVQMRFAEVGTTPTTFIQQQRLDLAGRRLEHGGSRCSITDVAFEVGFNDLSSFCRAFRRRFNVAPREYRAGIRHRGSQVGPATSR